MENGKALTHIVGTFLIQAEGAFLNGAGLGKGEDRTTTVPKTMSDFKDKFPYVSSQSWKHWLRETFKEENPDEPKAILKAIGPGSAKGTTNKIGTEMDPIGYAEDDIFGYMRSEKGQGKQVEEDETEDEMEDEEKPEKKAKTKTKSVMRPSPFSASILMSLRRTGWRGLDEAYVHLKEGSPLPYSTEFYNTQLQGVFGLNYSRLGVFRNEGDRIELDEKYQKQYEVEKKITVQQVTDAGKIYAINQNPRKERTTKILKALAVLRGGAKQAQFGTEVSPKVLIIAGLSCGNLIFNDLFEDTKEGPRLKLATFEELLRDYQDRIITPVYFGLRTGYLHFESERELKEWQKNRPPQAKPSVQICTPIEAVNQLTGGLPQ